MQRPSHSAATLGLFFAIGGAGSLTGCIDQNTDREPIADTRPMVGQIRQAEQDWAWVAAQDWYLVQIDGEAPVKDTEPWLHFREHTWLDGSAGCNRFTASYIRRAEAGLDISEIISTRMFCAFPDRIMQQEARMFHLLQSVDAYRAQPDRLDLLMDDVVVLSFRTERGEAQPEEDQPGGDDDAANRADDAAAPVNP